MPPIGQIARFITVYPQSVRRGRPVSACRKFILACPLHFYRSLDSPRQSDCIAFHLVVLTTTKAAAQAHGVHNDVLFGKAGVHCGKSLNGPGVLRAGPNLELMPRLASILKVRNRCSRLLGCVGLHLYIEAQINGPIDGFAMRLVQQYML